MCYVFNKMLVKPFIEVALDCIKGLCWYHDIVLHLHSCFGASAIHPPSKLPNHYSK